MPTVIVNRIQVMDSPKRGELFNYIKELEKEGLAIENFCSYSWIVQDSPEIRKKLKFFKVYPKKQKIINEDLYFYKEDFPKGIEAAFPGVKFPFTADPCDPNNYDILACKEQFRITDIKNQFYKFFYEETEEGQERLKKLHRKFFWSTFGVPEPENDHFDLDQKNFPEEVREFLKDLGLTVDNKNE